MAERLIGPLEEGCMSTRLIGYRLAGIDSLGSVFFPFRRMENWELCRKTFQAPNCCPLLRPFWVEALEPRQNRKRGDDLAAVEYIQKADPEIEKKKIKQMVDQAFK